MKVAIAVLLGLLLPLHAIAAPSIGTPVVFHSPDDNGTPPPGPNPPEIDALDGQPLNLYIDYDNSPDADASSGNGAICEDEDGDETCGFDVLIRMTSDTATFDTFTPASTKIVGHIDSNTRTLLRVNGIDTGGMLIPADIGTLTVDALDANQLQITVEGMHRVGAAGQLDAIQPDVLVNLVPEPGGALMLISGFAGLVALERWRGQRGAVA
jgi:hypothetical protein